MIGIYKYTFKVVKDKYEVSDITYLEVFGKKINVVPGTKYYRIWLDEAEIKSISNGCESPYKIKLSKGEVSFGYSGGLYNGSEKAYFGLKINDANVEDNIKYENGVSNIEYYDYFIEVFFNTPLKVADNCDKM